MTTRTLSISGLVLEAGPPSRPTQLVKDVSLALERGRVLALVGSSGGGKSLTTLALLNLLPPGVRRVAGTVALGDRILDAAGQDALRGRVMGFVQQAPRGGFNPLVTIGRHFRETLACDGLCGAEAEARISDLLREVGFEHPGRLLPLYPSQISGGMLQRAMLALALCRAPDFLLADEPTTDLDLVVQAQILDLLERLVVRRGIGLLLVTHDLSVVARLADHVAVMVGGRIVEQQPVPALFEAPRHPTSRALLKAHLALYGEALCPVRA
ncbi:ATP-binding cassette domain-containing protein [Roseomonas gilardii subsp. gilardii]|uniref:ATP-binding cassette domain-containing protein n=1 Tax=Roseomonas gilardii TaxID=257708 RepID=UPI001FF727D7|nr:ATP-binding cassette domain-containing protein [Roseomonas gilardii]UPG73862.1 ATP-binding cassette domain-containing protein [Roseomonas gilardii subsp. gilardii]